MSTIFTTIALSLSDPACLGGRRELKESSSPTDAFVLLSPTCKAVVLCVWSSSSRSRRRVFSTREFFPFLSFGRMQAPMCCEPTQNGQEEDATLSLLDLMWQMPVPKQSCYRSEKKERADDPMRRRADKRGTPSFSSLILSFKMREPERNDDPHVRFLGMWGRQPAN